MTDPSHALMFDEEPFMADEDGSSLLVRFQAAAVEMLTVLERAGAGSSHDVVAMACLARRRTRRLAAETELQRLSRDAARALELGRVHKCERDIVGALVELVDAYFAAMSRERAFARAFQELRIPLDDFESEVMHRLCCERDLRQALGAERA